MSTILSDVFKYISHFRRGGHQIGRKIGDMLEVLTLGAIYSNEDLRTRLHTEPKILGFSEAGHKVEFAVLHEPIANGEKYLSGGSIEDPQTILAFIECKKVGVEQTVNGKFKRTFPRHDNRSFKIEYPSCFDIKFAPRGMTPKSYTLHFESNGNIKITEGDESGRVLLVDKIAKGYRVIFTFGENGQSEIINNNGSLRDIDYRLRNCKILEIYSVDTDFCVGTLNDCLAGPQTPEKAKQASFVALDIRKKYSGSFDKQSNETNCVSVLVLTEFSHWEKKSQNMIKACIDVNMVVPDKVIVAAFTKFEEKYGSEGFLDKITKDAFLNDTNIQHLIFNILNMFEYKIFRDVESEELKQITYSNGQVVFTD